ncbi:MAG TPA: iron-sulfur cluster repair di-iron protein [Bryobacteraceae bacterium]|jgi:regulator of cell morphogenesis and NO signaling|nr:iron-sulfur cluster repair di-iron protein [Bryobacteraceae bacterium]
MQTIAEKTVREIALEHPASMPVFESLNIDYCCAGDRRLADACRNAGIEVDHLLRLIDRAERDANAPIADWRETSLAELIAHIVNKHHAFVRQEIPRIESLLIKVCAKHGSAHPELQEIDALFRAIGQELSTHLFKEEHVLFPYIERTENAAANGEPRPQACFDSVMRPIANMMAEHDDAGALLQQIRDLSGTYTPPAGACPTFHALYRALGAFERDLHQHVHLENNVLFPRAIEMEQA